MDLRASQALTARLPSTVFLLCFAAEALSFLGFLVPEVRTAALAACAVLAAVLAATNLRALFALLVADLVIGSHGRLFGAEALGFPLSLRMALFAALVLGWAVQAARGRSRILHFRHAHISGPLLLLVLALAWGTIHGLASGAGLRAVFEDANGYAFLLLIPIGLDLFGDRAGAAWLSRVFAGALAWLAVKSVALLYVFTHRFGPILHDLFTWQRTLRLGEITDLGGGAVRVFSASDVFLLPAVFVGVLLVRESRRALAWTALAVAAFLLSLSRSFWLGAAASALLLLPVMTWRGVLPLRGLPKLAGGAVLASAFAVLLLAAAALAPFPPRSTGDAAWNAYGARLGGASDAAVSSRWNMLPPLKEGIARAPIFGSGFGAAITYRSDDPRVISLHPGGILTTGAVEWQYLEIWLKLGLPGLLAVGWLWWRIGLLARRSIAAAQGRDRLLAVGLSLAFAAFIVANVFTPYVNHPLGWGFLALVAIGLHAAQGRELPEHATATSA